MNASRIISAIAIFLLIIGLVLVRGFEVRLFQDPLQTYFESGFQNYPIPAVNLLKQLGLTSLRFLMNTVLSLWILWFLYKRESYINASLWVYLIAYVALGTIFIAALHSSGDLAKMILFYARRFLIHPLLLFVLIAGFYFFLRSKGPIVKSGFFVS